MRRLYGRMGSSNSRHPTPAPKRGITKPPLLCAADFVLGVICPWLALNLVPLSGKENQQNWKSVFHPAGGLCTQPSPGTHRTLSMRVGPTGPQASRLCQSHPRTICNVETPVSLYLWARLSWFWAINPNGASAMWALVLEDQKCPATSLNYVIILPPLFPPG